LTSSQTDAAEGIKLVAGTWVLGMQADNEMRNHIIAILKWEVTVDG